MNQNNNFQQNETNYSNEEQQEHEQEQEQQEHQQQIPTPDGRSFGLSLPSSRYEIERTVGHGAYGMVFAARDLLTGERVAIKMVQNAFAQGTDAKRILREIKLLKYLRHDNILNINAVLKPPSLEQFESVFIVTELMDTDLSRIIRSSQSLTNKHVQYFLYQVLCGLKYTHSARVLHRDLKPGNLLLNATCDLKICDFGLARVVNDRQEGFTEYVVTRWYRAPEVLLQSKGYSTAIDVWSVGCIFAEMLGRKPLFPGNNYIEQTKMIIKILGTPSPEDRETIGSPEAREFLRSLPPTPKIPFSELFPFSDPLALDLLDKMLTFNPHRRISVEEALQHPYLADLHDPSDEPIAQQDFTFGFNENQLSVEDVRELIYEETLDYAREEEAMLEQLQNKGNLSNDNGDEQMQDMDTS